MNAHDEHFEVVSRTTDRARGREHALVLRAAGITYAVRKVGGEYVILVGTDDAKRALSELGAYEEENPVEDSPEPATPHDGVWYGVYGYACVLLVAGICAQRKLFDVDWYAAGRAKAGLIQFGDWWRCVTALTLHVDVLHFASNIVFGGIIGALAGHQMGVGFAWFVILIAGAAGNLLNAYIRNPHHSSIGASTSVFAALGLLAAHTWYSRPNIPRPSLMRWAPIIGAVVLLSMLGTSGDRTDVAAHVLGFVCGMVLGFGACRLLDKAAEPHKWQHRLSWATVFILVGAWAVALIRNEGD